MNGRYIGIGIGPNKAISVDLYYGAADKSSRGILCHKIGGSDAKAIQ